MKLSPKILIQVRLTLVPYSFKIKINIVNLLLLFLNNLPYNVATDIHLA
jgi:hypothetical protein